MFIPNQFTWNDGDRNWGLHLYKDGTKFLCYQHYRGDWYVFRKPKEGEVNWFKKYGKKSLTTPQVEIEEPVELVITEENKMAKLKSEDRKSLKSSTFGLPKERKYPMPDKAHAVNAKARSTQMVKAGKLSPSKKAQIDAKANAKLGKSKNK